MYIILQFKGNKVKTLLLDFNAENCTKMLKSHILSITISQDWVDRFLDFSKAEGQRSLCAHSKPKKVSCKPMFLCHKN